MSIYDNKSCSQIDFRGQTKKKRYHKLPHKRTEFVGFQFLNPSVFLDAKRNGDTRTDFRPKNQNMKVSLGSKTKYFSFTPDFTSIHFWLANELGEALFLQTWQYTYTSSREAFDNHVVLLRVKIILNTMPRVVHFENIYQVVT